MSNFPSTLSSYTDPAPTDRLNSPSHSSVEGEQNDGLEKIEAFIGTLSSSAGTLIYDVRAAASNGGGHVQTANKGGTGQTTYTKGDILVATSASALSKLAVGSDTQILESNSSTASGLRWIPNNTAPKVFVSGSVFSASGATLQGEVSILSATIPGSTLGTNGYLRGTVYVGNLELGTDNLNLKAKYGANTIANIDLNPAGSSATSMAGQIGYVLFAGNAINSQRGQLLVNLSRRRVGLEASVVGLNAVVRGTSSVESSANQTFVITMQANGTAESINTDGSLVEKVV